ncbi:MAG: hypothetical protein JO154_20710 [Chitinophaga sp.]|uniref:hypothetical protein n=1 Tax=Chitinophaga sp. TaxID=1869181 RepID=UPI0025BC7C27|nr:hypothetical protein [Chitinophaga sp.]MBV8255035.1 hypothetical protein [Chitinophaga sp.]
MERKYYINKTLKVILVIAGILAGVIFALGFYLNQRWNGMMREELKSYVRDMSDSLYKVEYKSARLNVLTGSVTLQKASMVMDTAVYERMLQNHTAPPELYLISVEKLELKYFKPWRYFRNKELNAGLLKVTCPTIVIEQNANVRDTSKPLTAYQHISPKMKSILIGTLALDSTHVRYKFIRKDSSVVEHEFRNLSIRVNDFLIDSKALNDPTRFLYARNYEIGMRDYASRTKDSLYFLNINSIRYEAAERILRIGGIEITPRYEKEAFKQLLGYQQDYYHVAMSDIGVYNINPKLLLQDQQIWADKVVIGGGKLEIYRDRSLPLPPGDKLGQFPNQVLAKFDVPLMVDTLMGHRVNLQYIETNPESGRTGELRLSNVNGRILNITNVDSLVKKNNHCIADIDAILMNSGKLAARFDFVLGSKTGNFAVSGELKNMNGKELNPVTKPLGKVEIRSCHIHELSFQIKGDERKASGQVKLLYDHLRIAILKEDKEHNEYVRKGLMSLLANIMALKESNPLPGENVRISRPTLQRDVKKSFFNLVWKTIFMGVKETAGTGKI